MNRLLAGSAAVLVFSTIVTYGLTRGGHSQAYKIGVSDAASYKNTSTEECSRIADIHYGGVGVQAYDSSSDRKLARDRNDYVSGCSDWTLAHGGK